MAARRSQATKSRPELVARMSLVYLWAMWSVGVDIPWLGAANVERGRRLVMKSLRGQRRSMTRDGQ